MKPYLIILLSILIVILHTWTAYAKNISVDSFPPFKVEINGLPGIFYSLKDDKRIIVCFEERELLRKELFFCDQGIDSLFDIINTYERNLTLTQSMFEVQRQRTNACIIAKDILQERIKIQNEINVDLKLNYNKLILKNKRNKKRNNILFTIGGIVLAGVTAGLIVKSVL